ncbi:MAG: RidA family protein [Fibrobacter sp.]|nr:RidA family protein [Fibrobacter sp.]
MDIKKKVEELGLTLPECPAPLAAYVPATRFGDVVAVSGQLPSVKGDFSAFCGTVPTAIPVEKAVEAARICLLNNIAAAMTMLQHGETLKLVQMHGFVQSDSDFHEQPAVLNGASELAVQILGDNGKHARTAVGVQSLPKNAAVEISCTFQVIPEEVKFQGSMNWIG